jgi:mono/diheme cytochrome c family protein
MKMNRMLVLIAVVCMVPSMVFAAGDAAKGKEVYTAKCKSCHGPDGVPAPAMAKAMGIKAMKDVQGKTDDEIKKTVTAGSGKMKPVAGVAGADLDNVVAYVRTLK